MTELAKTFDPSAIESRWYRHWEETGAFRPSRPDAEPFTIVMPPPNVTGSLHIGHALDNTLQDILIRHARLQGKDALWVCGTDHAGIATQMVVERQMNERQQKRTDFTRDEFVAKVWEWKAESGGAITRQLRRLGASCDWANERFTMDEGFSKAVLRVFVDLYNQGLLYRDKRLVNWDPGLKTAISDLEVETIEVNGKFWHLKYPLEDGSGFISVATTRPETMLADMAVAVNGDDPRYTAIVGKNVRLPITGRLIPVIADEHADPELGSGAVKITPGHDFNDFEVGKRAGFKPAEMLNMLDAEARVVQTADGLIPAELLGLTVKDARERVVALLDGLGLLEKVEDRTIQTPFGDRSGVVIEPWLTDQWYVDAATLAKPAIEAVRSGAIKVVPQSWEKTYFNWMENIQPWCVSRQLWWGHRIPAWFAEDGRCFVAETADQAQALAQDYYGPEVRVDIAPEDDNTTIVGTQDGKLNFIQLKRDEDVLDTWFSSALWPFGTLGWPEETPSPLEGEGGPKGRERGIEQSAASVDATDRPSPSAAVAAPPSPSRGEGVSLLARHYPNDVLISGFDILFFWDARMIMQGLHFMKEVPWKTLYLHGLVRAADGSKMSKSKGNTVDPLGLIDRFGADALRFTLTAMESQGRDIKLDEKRVEGYRNFATKLWNAARFCQSNGIGASKTVEAPPAALAVNRWIIGEVVETLAKLDKAIADLRYDAMADAIYHFAWGTFCDWYLELIKPVLSGGEGGEMGEETRAVAGWALDQILVMLHPFMPFITEELWHAMGARPYDLIHAQWPAPQAEVDVEAKRSIERVIEIITDVRSQRVDLNVPAAAMLLASIVESSGEDRLLLNQYTGAIKRLARIEPAKIIAEPGHISATATGCFENFEGSEGEAIATFRLRSRDLELFCFLKSGFADTEAERLRLSRAIEAISKERDSLVARLNNPAFVERAKPEAVEKARADHAEKAAEAERLAAALARLG